MVLSWKHLPLALFCFVLFVRKRDLRLPCGIIVKVSLYWFKWFVRKTALLGKCIFYGVMECFFVTVSNWWYEWLLSKKKLPATAWLGFGLQEALFCCFLLVFCISWSSGVFLFFGKCLIMTCVFCQPLVFVQKIINCHLEGLGKSVKLFTSHKKLLATCWSDILGPLSECLTPAEQRSTAGFLWS